MSRWRLLLRAWDALLGLFGGERERERLRKLLEKPRHPRDRGRYTEQDRRIFAMKRLVGEPLDPEEEAAAKELLALVPRVRDGEPGARERLRSIGERLHAKGGLGLMRVVAHRLRKLGGDLLQLELFWDGVGDWRR